jgi:DNA-binding NarL/FixJ family response regulator
MPCGPNEHLVCDEPVSIVFSLSPSEISQSTIWTRNECPEYLMNLIQLRPGTLISLSTFPKESVLEVARGLGYLGPQLKSVLTTTEREVLHLISLGHCSKRIAAVRSKSHRTVHNQIAAILRKFGVSSRVEAKLIYLGSITPPPV